MSTYPQAAVRRDPPWWVAVLAIPLFGFSLIFGILAGLSGVSLVDAVSADRQVSQTANLGTDGEVDINANSAGLIIEAGPDGHVSVTDFMRVKSPTVALARKALDTFSKSTLAATGAGVAVTIPTPEDFNLFSFSLERQVTVRVPSGAALKLRGQRVAADLRDLHGSLDLDVGSGAVRLKRVVVDGADRISATAGAIDFEGSLSSGSLDIQTDSGAINVLLPTGTNGTYDIATHTGAILVHPESGRSTTLAGTNESATGTFGTGSGGTIRLRASSGAVAVRVG